MYFSIIIPYYNKKERIFKSIHSVLNQTCSDFEIVLIDDFSNSLDYNYLIDLVGLLTKEHGVKISLIRNKSNKGPGYSRNVGIDNCSGKVLVFLDADDCLMPNYLKTIKDVFEKNKCSVLISRTIESDSRIIRPNFDKLQSKGLIYEISNNLYSTQDFVGAFCADPIFCGCANVAISRNVLEVTRFNEVDRNFEDWLFFYEVCTRYSTEILFQKICEGAIYFNESSESLSRKVLKDNEITTPLWFDDLSFDFRFTHFLYFNWLFSVIKRSAGFTNRIYIFAKFFNFRFYKKPPVWRFFIPTIMLLFKLDLLVVYISGLWKKIKYDY